AADSDLLTRLKFDTSPPLFFLMLKPWAAIFGSFEWSLRLLSVCGGVLLVAAAYRTAKELFDRSTALVVAALLSVHPAQVDYAQQVRPYFWLALMSVLCMLSL